jgi:membrane AbrB-like protein
VAGQPRQAGPWLVVLVVTVVVSAVLSAFQLPSPVLFGALVGGMVQALGSARAPAVPPLGFQIGQGLVGVTIGALVSVPTLARLGADWPSILGVTVGTLLISVLAGQLLGLRHDVSATTGAFALIAGGASGITALARELGADDRVVTIVQYLRVLLVLLTLPLATTLLFHPASGLGTVAAAPTRWLPDLVFTVVSVAGGLAVARLVRIPAGSLLGPLLLAVAFSVSGVLGTLTVPTPLQDLGYALIGIQVGLRFTRASLVSIARLLPVTVLLIFLVILGCAAMGQLLSAVTGVDPLTAYLASTPGGLFAVLATAADSGSDVTYVLAVQVIRVLVMLLAAPLLSRLLSRRRVTE